MHMGVVRDREVVSHDGGDGGSNVAVVAVFVIALIVILAVVLYGFAWGHWFNMGGTVNVVTSPGGGGASPMPSISPSK
jgi:hypothetical protein